MLVTEPAVVAEPTTDDMVEEYLTKESEDADLGGSQIQKEASKEVQPERVVPFSEVVSSAIKDFRKSLSDDEATESDLQIIENPREKSHEPSSKPKNAKKRKNVVKREQPPRSGKKPKASDSKGKSVVVMEPVMAMGVDVSVADAAKEVLEGDKMMVETREGVEPTEMDSVEKNRAPEEAKPAEEDDLKGSLTLEGTQLMKDAGGSETPEGAQAEGSGSGIPGI